MTSVPRFSVLTPKECAEVLARNHVGRLAFRVQRALDIQPLGYVARDQWLFLRSAYGAKLDAITSDPFVAFEVDEIDGPFDWRSVVVHGTVYVLQADGGPVTQPYALQALEALRTAMPETHTASDPVPERRILYGLNIQQVSGRKAWTGVTELESRRELNSKPLPPRRLPADIF